MFSISKLKNNLGGGVSAAFPALQPPPPTAKFAVLKLAANYAVVVSIAPFFSTDNNIQLGSFFAVPERIHAKFPVEFFAVGETVVVFSVTFERWQDLISKDQRVSLLWSHFSASATPASAQPGPSSPGWHVLA